MDLQHRTWRTCCRLEPHPEPPRPVWLQDQGWHQPRKMTQRGGPASWGSAKLAATATWSKGLEGPHGREAGSGPTPPGPECQPKPCSMAPDTLSPSQLMEDLDATAHPQM